jgi:hypothetical protein
MTIVDVQQKSFSEKIAEKDFANRPAPLYGEGEVVTLMLVSVFSVFAGEGFTMVVLVSFFSAGGLATVVSFCSQAVSTANPAKMQMYFFM